MKKILILASNPRQDLNLDHEIRDLKSVVERSHNQEQFEVETELAVRVSDLQDLLLKHRPHIVHFCGHGSGAQGLIFEGEQGGEQWLRTEALSHLFKLCSGYVQCVLLNACYSNEQADAIVEHIDYVVGMTQTIQDNAAIAFSKGFYRALGYACSIEEAYEFGCNAIQLEITGSSSVRSGAFRKAEVINAVAKTLIPEHAKPILKRNPQALNRKTSTSPNPTTLSPSRKEEFQVELAQVLQETRADATAPVGSGTNRSGTDRSGTDRSRTDRSGMQSAERLQSPRSPQEFLDSPTPSRQRWLWIGVAVCVIPIVGFLGLSKLSGDRQTEPAPPVSQANSVLPADPEEKPLPSLPLGLSLLQQAEVLQENGNLEKAIALLGEIPADSPDVRQSMTYLNLWSRELFDEATKNYNKGRLNKALKQAKAIPENSQLHDQVQDAIAQWEADQKTMNDLINIYLVKHDINNAKVWLEKIKSPGLREQAQNRFDEVNKIVEDKKKEQEAAGSKDPETPVVSPDPDPSDKLYPWLSEREVTAEDLKDKTPLELDVMRNSIYARRGLIFRDSDLKSEFAKLGHEGTIANSNDIELTALEDKNVQSICNFQKQGVGSQTTQSCSKSGTSGGD